MTTGQLGAVVGHLRTLAGSSAYEPSDGQLLERFQRQRDQSAFAALVRRHGRLVWGVCRNVLHHDQDAEDAFQATFLVLVRQAAMVRKPEALASWLHGVAYRVAMRARRAAGRRRVHERVKYPAPRAAGAPVSECAWRELQAALDEEVQALPERLRVPFVLCCVEGRSQNDVAARLGCKVSTVSSWLTRARKELLRRLARRGVSLSAALAALALARECASAAPPALLAHATIRAAAGSTVSAHLDALVKRASQAMVTGKMKIAMVILIAASVAAAACGLAIAPAADESAKPQAVRADTKSQAAEAEAVAFTGRVVNPDGKPITGAKLHLIAQSWASRDPLYVQSVSAPDGGFRLSVAPSDARRLADEPSWSQTSIFATAKGYGPALSVRGPFEPAGDLTLRLAKDDVPIHGRILDLQGKPIADVKVRVDELCVPKADDLTPWLEALEANKLDGYNIQHRFLEGASIAPSPRLFPDIVTDAEGRFQIKGVGRERVVGLTLEGPTIVHSHGGARVKVRTRPGKPIRAALFARNPEGGQITYYGADFDHTAAPTRPIIGVVRDLDTGKPIAGVTVQSAKFAGTNVSGDSSVRTVTDKEGRYRLVGMPKGVGNSIKAKPATGQPYFQSVREVEDTPGLEPITMDFDLKRGVLVKGRVLDKVTGKPVFANVQYLAFADNPRPKRVPGWAVEHYLQTGDDGAFQLVAFPGRGLVAARGWNDHYRMAVGADKVPKKDWFGADRMLLSTQPYLFQPANVHTLVEINPAENAESLTQDIILDPGTMPRGTITGPDGKPLAGTKVLGLTAYGRWGNWTRAALKSADFTVYGLDANEERAVVFIHAEKRLAAALKVRGDAKGPLAVKLEPWGIVTGRLVTEDGKPRSGVLLQITNQSLPNNECQSNSEGRFRIEGLASGVSYTMQAVQNGKPTGQVFSGLILKSGESRDLGDIQLKRKD